MTARAYFVGQLSLPLGRAVRPEVIVEAPGAWLVRVPCACGEWLEATAEHEHGAARERRRLAARRCRHVVGLLALSQGTDLAGPNAPPSGGVGTHRRGGRRLAWLIRCPIHDCTTMLAGATSQTRDGWQLAHARMRGHLAGPAHDLSGEDLLVALDVAAFLRSDEIDGMPLHFDACQRATVERMRLLVEAARAEAPPRRVRSPKTDDGGGTCGHPTTRGGRCTFQRAPRSSYCGRHLRD